MKSIRIYEHGNADVLRVDDIDIPSIKSEEVLVKIKACSINHLDIWVRNGLPGLPIQLPLILGSDASGTIIELGNDVKNFNVGDDIVVQPGIFNENCSKVKNGKENYSKSYGIIGEHINGVQAEYVSLNTDNVYKKPMHLSYEEAASMQLVFMTAYQMIVKRAQLNKDEIILIYGATSGVGSAAIQISKDLGSKIITTVGNKSKIQYAYDMGADYVFLHNDSLINNVKNISKEGVDVVFEHVGQKTWNSSLRLLSRGGRIVTCGSTTGSNVNIDLRHLFMKQQSILGSTMSDVDSFKSVMNKIYKKCYNPFVDTIFSFKDIKNAHKRMEDRNNFGKIILVP